MSGNPELRQKLEDAVKLNDFGDFARRLERLRHEHSHGITIIEMSISKLSTFNCYAYALGIWENSEYLRRKSESARDIPVVISELVQSMLERGDFEPTNAESIQLDDMLLYFDGDDVKHGARHLHRSNVGSIVRSKWGPNELFEHEMWEIPASYGDRVKFFKKPTLELCLRRIDEFWQASEA